MNVTVPHPKSRDFTDSAVSPNQLRFGMEKLRQMSGCSRATEVCKVTKDQKTLRTNTLTPDCCVRNLSRLLIESAEFFSRHGIHYWLDGGSLLGIVREQGLLSWDRDVDFGFHAHQEQAIFEAFVFEGKPHRTDIGDVGFVLESGLFYVPNWGRDYAGNPAPIPRIYFSPINRLYADLYPYYRTAPGKFGIGRIGPFTYDINEQNVLELSSLEWNGSMILTPSNAENYLAQRFGNDWHVPDPDFYQKYPPHSDKLKAKLNLQ